MVDNRDFEYSRPLDVHKWSDHKEVNNLVNDIYENYLDYDSSENSNIQKKHLKVILLDLYLAWLDDPELHIAVHMTTAAYSDGTVANKGKSRYNELHIKVSTMKVVHYLGDAGLIGVETGKEGIGDWDGRITRIWPYPPLISLFEAAAFGELDIGYSEDRETIVLRDEDKFDVEYVEADLDLETRSLIREMRPVLSQYNKLLERTFIDIPSLNEPRIELPEKTKRRRSNKPLFVAITHQNKFVRRVFNNNSFNEGGRFYGGWWQRIDSKFRKDIRMNNVPTVEIDYSSLHVILAYAEANLDYWQGTDKDPYDLPVRGVNSKEHCRDICKLFLLLSLNASTEQSLFRAFRSELDYREYAYSFPDEVLSELLNTIREHHSEIEHLICSGAGLRLMNIDSRICEYVISEFIKTDTPILTVHDSFIVQIGQEDRLYAVMKEGYQLVTNKLGIKAKFNENITKTQLYAHGAQDRNWFLDMIASVTKGNPTNGYSMRWERHKGYFNAR